MSRRVYRSVPPSWRPKISAGQTPVATLHRQLSVARCPADAVNLDLNRDPFGLGLRARVNGKTLTPVWNTGVLTTRRREEGFSTVI